MDLSKERELKLDTNDVTPESDDKLIHTKLGERCFDWNRVQRRIRLMIRSSHEVCSFSFARI